MNIFIKSQLKSVVIKFTQLFDIYPNRSLFKQLKPLIGKHVRLMASIKILDLSQLLYPQQHK